MSVILCKLFYERIKIFLINKRGEWIRILYLLYSGLTSNLQIKTRCGFLVNKYLINKIIEYVTLSCDHLGRSAILEKRHQTLGGSMNRMSNCYGLSLI